LSGGGGGGWSGGGGSHGHSVDSAMYPIPGMPGYWTSASGQIFMFPPHPPQGTRRHLLPPDIPMFDVGCRQWPVVGSWVCCGPSDFNLVRSRNHVTPQPTPLTPTPSLPCEFPTQFHILGCHSFVVKTPTPPSPTEILNRNRPNHCGWAAKDAGYRRVPREHRSPATVTSEFFPLPFRGLG
jgi:hypothetical protein